MTVCGSVMLLPHVSVNKVIFLLRIMLTYDKPLLTGQPPLGGHLLVPRVWPVNGGSAVLPAFLHQSQ